MKRILPLLIALFCGGMAAAQPRCGFDAVHQQMLTASPAYQQQVTQLNSAWVQKMAASANQFVTSNSNGTLYEIPVVIHVIHTGGAVGSSYNPSDATLIALLNYLNQTFAATYASYPNTSNGGVYFPVKFVLAQRSPSCAATTGIIRTDGSVLANYTSGGITTNSGSTTSAQDAAVKALDLWPNDRYYNIWVVNKIDGNDGTFGTFTAGYAYFPGAPPGLDGTVMLATQAVAGAITLPHEIGHAFSLYHTFEGDGSGNTCPPTTNCATTGDLICDTEPHKRSPFNCPSNPNPCTGLSYNNVQRNFMDYSNCQDRFTAGQKTRFMDGLLNSRPGLAYSITGNPLPGTAITAASCSITGLANPGNSVNAGPTRVELANLVHSSLGYNNDGNQYYIDRSCAYQATVNAGQSYTLSINTQTNAQRAAVWIDYNNDGQFTLAEQVYAHTGTTATETHSTTITIPANATSCIPLRMRVIADITGSALAANGCGTLQYGQAEDFSVLVGAGTTTLTNAITSGTNPSCPGAQLTFTATPSAAVTSATYTWSVNGTQVQTGASNTYTSATLANGAIVNVAASFTTACGVSATATSNDITVVRSTVTPSVTIAASATTICSGTTVNFTATPVNGGTPAYQWKVNGNPAGTNSNFFSSNTLANGNTVTVDMTSSLSCASPATVTSNAITMVVNTIPAQPGTITGATAVCNGVAQTYSVTNDPLATSYAWSLPTGWTGTSTTNSITVTPSGSGGTISVTPSNSCGPGTARTLAVTSSATPASPGAINGATLICQGIPQTYSIANVTNATTYTWTVPAGWTGSSTTSSIIVTPNGSNGTLSVTAGNYCGTPTGSNLAITVTNTPAQPAAISGAIMVCLGVAQTYTVPNNPAVTAYNWTLPSGWTGTSTTNSITTTPSINSGTISVTGTNLCGTSTASALAVTSGTIPAQPGTITGSTVVCSGASQTYSVPNDPLATGYNWTLPSGWTGTSATNSITVTPNGTGGTISVYAANNCGNGGTRTLAVTSSATPAQPSAITGPASLCAGTSGTYTVTANPAVTAYNWTLPSGWTGTSTTNSINLTTNGVSGTISVTGTNYCGTSTSSSLTINSASIPTQPGLISGVTAVCTGVGQTYSVATVTGATSYNWTLPAGWGGTSTTNSISTTPNGTGGTISVTASNVICGASIPRTLAVTSSATPAQPSTISGATAVCSGVAQTYSVTNSSSVTTYNWTLPAGWGGTSATNSITATPTATGGTLSVTGTNYCGTSTARTLAVTSSATPVQPGTISGNATVCSGTFQTYTVPVLTGVTTYTWNLPSGWSGTSTTNSITATVGTGSGTVSVTAGNYCGTSVAQTIAVMVNSIPAQPAAITGATTVCSGSTQTYSVPAVNGATAYNWTLPGGWSGSSATNSITVNVGGTGGTISVTAANNCGAGAARTLAVVNAPVLTPAVSINATVTTFCAGTPVTFTPVTVNGGGSPVYTWYVNGGVVSSGSSYTTTTLTNGDNVSVMLQSNALCAQPNTATSTPVQVTVNPVLTPSVSIPTMLPSPICSGMPLMLTANGASGGTAPQYQWYRNNVAIPGETMSTLTFVTATGNDVYRVSMTSNAPCTTSPTAQSGDKTVIVTQSVMPTVSLSVLPGTFVPAGSTAVFTATWSSPGTSPTVVWRRNGAVINGVTGTTYSGTNIQSGDTVSVQLTNNEGCATPATVSAGILMRTPLGTANTAGAAAAGNISIHPNPSNGRFAISVSGMSRRGTGDVGIRVINALGQEVFTTTIKPVGASWNYEVNLPDAVASGLYQVSIRTDEFRVSKPVLLKR